MKPTKSLRVDSPIKLAIYAAILAFCGLWLTFRNLSGEETGSDLKSIAFTSGGVCALGLVLDYKKMNAFERGASLLWMGLMVWVYLR